MLKRFAAGNRTGLLLVLFMVAVVTALSVLPGQFTSSAGSKGKGLIVKTSVHDNDLAPIWDIRDAKGQDDNLIALREMSGKDASFVADVRDRVVRGEVSFKAANPTAKVEYTTDLRNAEVLTPDVYRAKFDWLTRPSSSERADILRDFVKEHNDLVGVTNEQADALIATADYQSPEDGLGWARLEQRIHGVPVFRGEINAGFTKRGELIRAINNIAPGIDYATVSRTFNDPANAVAVAAQHIKHELRPSDTARNDRTSTDLKVVFGEGDWATTAEKMYFPTELGVAVPAWRVLIWQPVTAFYVMVDAQTGVVLWHKNLGDDQTQSATYSVYTNPAAYQNYADAPASLSPYGGPTSNPTLGTQAPLGTRASVTLIGNEAPYTFNNNGWMTDGTNITDGNLNQAGIDRDGINGVDAALNGDTACPGAGCRTFTSTWNPPPGSPAPGDDPLTAQAQRGAVTHMFYTMNRYHDELYLRGFVEAARNFQQVNFTGMGLANDRVSSEGQDSSGTNNANFAAGSDGTRGRMQMYLWSGPTPDRDGTGDTHIIIHEVSHGTSNRIIGNNAGLGNQGGMMGEGWGDWYAHTLTAQPTDDPLGVHAMGGYSLYQLGAASFTSNYYHGIRRFPTAVMASTGGPMNKPHNPLTFGHINSTCDTTLGTTTTAVASAYPRNPVVATSGSCSQVHNAGEIWKSALWEVRGLFVARRGFASGTTAVLTAVTEGMKLTPNNPTMLQARDGIITAAQAVSASPDTSADAADVREGFRIRGMGYSASVTSASVVTEAFDSATLAAGSGPVVTTGNNLLEPNECNNLNIPLSNNSGATATGITGVLTTSTAGVTVTQPNSAYPDIPAGGTNVNNTTPYQVSTSNSIACFTSANFTLTVSYSGGGGGSPLVINFSLPIGQAGLNYVATTTTGTIPSGGTFVTGSQADDAVLNIPLPAGWSSSIYGTAVTSIEADTNGNITVNSPGRLFSRDGAPLPGAGTNNPLPAGAKALLAYWDDIDMRTPQVTDGGMFTHVVGSMPNRQLIIEWRGEFFNEATTAVNTNLAIVLNEGSENFSYIYTLTGAGTHLNGATATVGVQAATTGTQFTQFSHNTASLSAGLRINFARPAGVCNPGSGGCSSVPRSRADFDGDGKTDLSVFRPSEGNWYLNRSTAGFQVLKWGIATDTPVPGDYDGDGKADTAIYRPVANPADPDYYILNSNGFTVTGLSWGLPNDIPISGGDYNGDGRTDLSVFRPSEGRFYIYNSGMSATPTVQNFGLNGDVPVAIDNDGDGRTNIAVIRPSENRWYIARPTGNPATNFDVIPFGAAGDIPAQADYDGDGKDDVTHFRPSTGQWIARLSTNGSTIFIPFGQSGDVPVPGDYDGNGTDDQAVYRNGTWWIRLSTGAVSSQAFGVASDTPIPNKYLPTGGGGGPGPGGEVTVSYTGPAVAITDNAPAGVSVNLVVGGVGTVSDLNFRVDTVGMGVCDGTAGDTDCGINHTWVGDLIIKITPPDGSPTVSIFDRPGVPTVSTVGCNNNNLNLTLNSDGALPLVENQGNPSSAACNTAFLFPTGSFTPNNPLDAFDGENANGTWVINISDNAGADTGSVRAFSLIFNGAN